jgi:hypothetical protein
MSGQQAAVKTGRQAAVKAGRQVPAHEEEEIR